MTSPWQPPDSGPTGQSPVPPPAAAPPPAAVPAAAVPAAPRFGEMAPPGYVPWTAPQTPPVAPTNQPAGIPQPPTARRSRTADVAVTCVLLGLGLFGAFAGLIIGIDLGPALAMEYAKYDVPYSAPTSLDAIRVLISVSHIVLYLAAAGICIPLMIRRRPSFWVPLTAGVVAGLILWISLIALIASDPSLMAAITASEH